MHQVINSCVYGHFKEEHEFPDPNLTSKYFEASDMTEMGEIYSGYLRLNNAIDSVLCQLSLLFQIFPAKFLPAEKTLKLVYVLSILSWMMLYLFSLKGNTNAMVDI